MIAVEHLYKSFRLSSGQHNASGSSSGKFNALDDISFTLHSGKSLLLLGTKNSGKSTLLKILGAMLPADSGTVNILGLDPQNESAQIRKQTGYFAAGQPFFEYLSVKEQLLYFGNLKAVPKAELKINADVLMEQWSLNPSKKVSALTAEERLRLGIAQALVNRPKLLLLDEPGLGLDVFTSKPLISLTEYAKTEGISLIYAGNNISKTELFGDELLILHRGRTVYKAAMSDFRKSCGNAPAEAFMKIISAAV